ncbi:MAG TPA: radical SAM protein, partial [Candidatus Acidoferrum sp.]|nr:radical SAM protein [Candidatus Acidoferrum sp.]
SPITRSLPRTIRSLCPECLRTIPAEEFIEDGRVIMRKSCPAHGAFRDIVFSDAEMFLRMEAWHFGDGQGFANPAGDEQGECPQRCGICGWHTSHTSLANVDLTSRCNLACSVCFADANQRAYEITFDQAEETLRRLRAQSPAPAFAVQFTGGEPTVHPRFLDIVASAKALGFSHIQVASNGLALADPEFACRAREAGLQYIYLQMDGTTDEVFRKIRGRPLLDTKLAVLQAARTAGLRVIFVPTILAGVNDHEIGDLFRLAFEHLDVLSGISFQPMTFTGRMPEGDRLRLRFTLSDLAREFSRQTGITHPQDDWFPLSSAVPLIRYAGALSGAALVNHPCHPHCGLMTLLFVDQERRATPVTRFLDLYRLLRDIEGLAAKAEKTRIKALSKIQALRALNRYFKPECAPAGLTFLRFLQTLDGFADKKYSWDDAYRGHTYKTFYLAGMHFMDAYNYDLERVARCGVHYSAPDGRIYPFCSYNSGPTYRKRVEGESGWPV